MEYKLILIFVMCIRPGLQKYSRFYEKNQRKCVNLLREPNYSEAKVVGNMWHEYYSWNLISKHCITTEFSKPSPKIIRRFEDHMNDYMKTNLEWVEATMLAKSSKHEMLMFDDEGPPGSFQGIPDFSQYGDIYEFAMHEIEPMKFAMKLLRGDKFLIMLDCIGGLGHVMARANDTVRREEILSVAEEVGIGKGYIGCESYISAN